MTLSFGHPQPQEGPELGAAPTSPQCASTELRPRGMDGLLRESQHSKAGVFEGLLGILLVSEESERRDSEDGQGRSSTRGTHPWLRNSLSSLWLFSVAVPHRVGEQPGPLGILVTMATSSR